jgi:hypothetical protein
MLENTELPTEEAHSKSFTVIGFWTDTDQRFCDVVCAATAFIAEDQCLQTYPGIAVCGVIAGSHSCVDSSPYLKYHEQLS